MRTSVIVRPYGKKEIKYLLVIRTPRAKEDYINLGPVSKTEAKRRRLATLHELNETARGTRQQPTVKLLFAEMVERYFNDHAKTSLAPRTVESYKGALASVIERFGRYRLDQITKHDLERYRADYKVNSPSSKGGNRAKNICLTALRQVFHKAIEWGYLQTSPAASIKMLREDKQGSLALTPEQVERIWNGMTRWHQSVFMVFLNSGMRIGEVTNLKLKDIDWEQRQLNVVSDENRRTKNGKTRSIPLNQPLYEELSFLRDNLPDYGGKRGSHPRQPHQQEYVFCHPDGSKIKSFKSGIKTMLNKHGIRNVSSHGFRKTFCSHMARMKINPATAQKILGHSDVKLTLGIYTQVEDSQMREAVDVAQCQPTHRESDLKLVANGN